MTHTRKETFDNRGDAAEFLLEDLVSFTRLGTFHLGIGDSQHRYIKAYLDNSFESKTYDRMCFDLYVDSVKVDAERIDLQQEKYKPYPNYKPHLQKGGHWWGYDGAFYGWVPNNEAFKEDVRRIIKWYGFADKLKD